jgi:hypothetical protein
MVGADGDNEMDCQRNSATVIGTVISWPNRRNNLKGHTKVSPERHLKPRISGDWAGRVEMEGLFIMRQYKPQDDICRKVFFAGESG